MKYHEKAKELKTQFGDNAKYVCIEVIEVLKKLTPNHEDSTYWHPMDFWRQVKEELETSCNANETIKHE